MAKENKFIRTELRYYGEDELKIIRDELSISGATTIGEYDGMVEADLPISSLEILKKSRILMDFPSKQGLPTGNDLELFNVPVIEPEKKRSIEETEWLSNFKEKASRVYIDRNTNTLKTRSEAGEEPEADSSAESGYTPEVAGGDMEMVSLPENKSEEEAIAEESLYIILFKGPLNSNWRSLFNEHEIKLASFFENTNEYSYKAILTKTQYEYLVAQDITASVNKYDIEKKLTDNLIKELTAEDQGFEVFAPLKKFDIVLSDEKYLGKLEESIRSSRAATVIDSGLNTIRIEISPDSALLQALAGSPYVCSLNLYEPPTLYCDVSRKIVGLEYTNKNSTTFWGESEVVGVIDSGIDDKHPDLKNQIKSALQYGMGSTEDQLGHGTHVAGIICGDGTSSATSTPKIIGIAPEAKVVSIGIVDEKKKLDLPVDIGQLLKIAMDEGAKIINLSWGHKVSGEYLFGSFSVDKFIYENPEILVVVAAGNDGNALKGTLAYKTVGSPATAKNVLTVGACSGTRTSPFIDQTWGNRKPTNFPAPPLNTTKLITAVSQPSLGSSTGPSDFDSIKPEVLAPGTYILSAKANASTISPTSREYYDSNYRFDTGTSMAAPVVSGIAAVLREYLRKVHNCSSPSSALIKAIIIGNSHQIASYRQAPGDPSLSRVGFPDFDQGFGLVDLNKLLNDKSIEMLFKDILNTDPKALESRAPLGGPVKSSREYSFGITGNTDDLSITLCWIDPPARGVQNNLQLCVKLPSNQWKLGNMDHNYKKDELFDTLFDLKPLDKYNNTEKVLIKNPPPGKYLIRIMAQNTLSKQGYSLVILGSVSNFIER